MPSLRHITASDVVGQFSWRHIVAALEAGHKAAKPNMGDLLLERDADSLLTRSAWIDGLGIGVKSVSIMPDNHQHSLPSIHGVMLVFDDQTGVLDAVIDNDVVTYWKTASDSVLGAKYLARPDSKNLLILGAGIVAESLVRAYCEIFDEIDTIQIWNRTSSRANQLADKLQIEGFPVTAVAHLPIAAGEADIICTATMSERPLLLGEWVQPGTHVDLVGSFRADMREADDALLQKGRVFVNCIETTVAVIGELLQPLTTGAIKPSDIFGDLYDLVGGAEGRTSQNDITVYKNGGGAHLDLITAKTILKAVSTSN